MSETYFYPKINRSAGLTWHLLYKCWLLIDREPINSGDTSSATFLTFEPPLTVEEKVIIDDMMSDPDTVLVPFPPQGSVFEIKDIYNYWADFLASVGVPDLSDPKTFTQWYVESVPGSGVYDIIQLQAPRVLKTPEINALMSAYANIIRKV